MNPERIYMLYEEMSLPLRNKVLKRRVMARLCDDRTVATHVNQPGSRTLSKTSLRRVAGCAF